MGNIKTVKQLVEQTLDPIESYPFALKLSKYLNISIKAIEDFYSTGNNRPEIAEAMQKEFGVIKLNQLKGEDLNKLHSSRSELNQFLSDIIKKDDKVIEKNPYTGDSLTNRVKSSLWRPQ